MTTLFNDIKYALRQFRRTPGFTFVTVVTLAVGIGVNAAVFSLINGWILRPLPGQRDGQLIRLFCQSTEPEGKYRLFSYPYFKAFQQENSCFTHLAAYTHCVHLIRNEGISRTVIGAFVSSNYFDTLGVSPVWGRLFTAEEEQPGCHDPVVILGHRFWQRLGADPGLIGKNLILNDIPVTVVGILPASFISASQSTHKDYWLPLGMKGGFPGSSPIEITPRLLSHDHQPLFLIGQLKPGFHAETIAPQLQSLACSLATRHPKVYGKLRLSTGPVGNFLMSRRPGQPIKVSKPLTALIIVSACILLIACLNLGHMFLARGLSRQRDIGIQLALGCRRFQIARQLLLEGFMLSLVGAGVGTLLALVCIRVPVRAFEQWTGGEGTIPTELDWRLLLAGLGLSVLTTLLFSLGPAWYLTRSCQITHRRDSVASISKQQSWWRRSTIAAQIALAFVLVTCAGLFVQSARAAATSNPGFSLDRGLLIQLALRDKGRETIQRILTNLRGQAGIETVSLSTNVPYCEAHNPGHFCRMDPLGSSDHSSVYTHINTIGADYFKSLSLPLLSGREFTRQEEQSDQGTGVALIDRVLAERLWPDKNPIGQFLQDSDRPERRLRVVGVVPHLRTTIMETQAVPWVYIPYGQNYSHALYVNVQLTRPLTSTMTTQMKQTLQESLLSLVPDLRLRGIRTWPEQIDSFSFQSLSIKLGAQLFATLGLLALALAILGLYSIKSHGVAQRSHEMGIRMALGASKGSIIALVLREGSLVTLMGLMAGLVLTCIGTRFWKSLLFQNQGNDPFIFVTTMALLTTTILLASFIPAHRAAQIDPMEALRYE